MNRWFSWALYAFVIIIALDLFSSLFVNLAILASLIFVITKALYFFLVIGLLIGTIKAIKSFNLNKKGVLAMSDKNKQLKSFGVVLIGLIFVWYIFNGLVAGNGGVSYGYMGGTMGGGYMDPGLSLQGLLAGILVFAIKIFWFLLLIGIMVGVFQVVRKYVFESNGSGFDFTPLISKFAGSEEGYSCPSCKEKLSQEFKFCPNCKQSLRNQCSNCGKELLAGWKCCPSCGAEKQ